MVDSPITGMDSQEYFERVASGNFTPGIIKYLKAQRGWTDEDIQEKQRMREKYKTQVERFKAARAKREEPFTQSNQFHNMLQRMQQMAEEAKQAPPSSQIKPLSGYKLEREKIRFLLGGSTHYDEATRHSPMFFETDVTRWLFQEFDSMGLNLALLLGGTGTCKTFGAIAYGVSKMSHELNWNKTQLVHVSGQYIKAIELYDLFQTAQVYGTVGDSAKQKIKKLSNIPWLILDELGQEPTAGVQSERETATSRYLRTCFENFFDERYMRKRKTIITTNSTPQQFKLLYGDRVMSRLAQIGAFYETTSKDMRYIDNSSQ